MGMKIDLCSYSGYKVYACMGSTYDKADGKVFRFLDGRSKKAHLLKRNPRKVTWAVLYRRRHRKGVEEETSKRRTKRTHKFQRAIVGASLNEILAKKNQKEDLRKAMREEAARAVKEKKQATRAAKKAAAPAKAPVKQKAKATQKVQKAAP